MAIETSVEYYRFTCARCGARWTEDYQVSEAVDDAGNVRSFYRYHGVSCEAPVRGNVECPNCHDTRSRQLSKISALKTASSQLLSLLQGVAKSPGDIMVRSPATAV